VYISENTTPWGRGYISRCHFGGKNMKRGRETERKCKRNRMKGEKEDEERKRENWN
jgi:hypothetical protein